MNREQGLRHLRDNRKAIERTRATLEALLADRRRLFVALRGQVSNADIAEAAGVSDVIVIRERVKDREAS